MTAGTDTTITAGVFEPALDTDDYFTGDETLVVKYADGSYGYSSGDDQKAAEIALNALTQKTGNTPTSGYYPVAENGQPDESEGPVSPSGTVGNKSPEFVGIGFEASGADAAEAIEDVIGLEGWEASGVTAPTAGNGNVMWAVVDGTPGNMVNFKFTYAAANSNTGVAFNTGNTAECYVMIGSDGYGVVWFTMDGRGMSDVSGTPDAADAAPTMQVPVCSTYTATAWPAGGANTYAVSTSGTVSVNGVAFVQGRNNTPISGLANLYGEAGTDVQLYLGQDVTAPDTDQALSAWVNGGQDYVPGDAFTLPEPSGYLPLQMSARFGTLVNLNATPASSFPSNPDAQNGVFVTGKGTQMKTDAGDAISVYKVGATAGNALPALPNLLWNNSDTSSNDGYAFVGWYTYDSKTDTYTLWQEGDAIPADSDTTLTLNPLFAPVTITWTPASPAYQVAGQSATYKVSVTVDEDALAEALEDYTTAEVEPSPAASAFFDDMVTADLTYAGDPDEDIEPNKFTKLYNVTLVGGASNNVAGVPEGTTVTHNEDGTEYVLTLPANAYKADGTTDTLGLYVNLPAFDGSLSATTPSAVRFDAGVTIDPEPPIVVNVEPTAEAGTVTQTMNANGQYVLTAVAADGWHFDHWNGPLGTDVGSNPTITVGRGSTSIGTYTAVFAPGQEPAEGDVTVYRVYNPNSGEHLYTTSTDEYRALVNRGWDDEGTAWVAPATSDVPVYRLFNPNNQDHYYCTSRAEADGLVKLGWAYDFGGGAAFYSAPQTGVPIYQLFNSHADANTHLWTGDLNEYLTNIRLGWTGESTAWYAVSL